MRSRGAKVTDIVVLVVAADDGVMPQTVEAINHSKASGVPIIVAVNKMDKPDADPDRVQRELSEHGLMSEAWGGDAIFVMVSAKKNTGIDELLEMILLQAEILELKANPDKLASGHVVEAKLDSGRGPVATVLVQEGTLRAGDSIVCGMHYGKIRVLQDDLGRTVESAGPSMPVEIVGLSGVPMAGDELVALADEKDARQVSQHRTQKQRSKELAKTNRLSLEGLFEKMQQGEVKDLNLIIKADVDGSIEALRDSLVKLSNEEVSINVVHAATGTITESDISLAAVSNAIIIGFNVRPNAKVQELAAEENVDMRFPQRYLQCHQRGQGRHCGHDGVHLRGAGAGPRRRSPDLSCAQNWHHCRLLCDRRQDSARPAHAIGPGRHYYLRRQKQQSATVQR
jgi:translation initiation factor IF-2